MITLHERLLVDRLANEIRSIDGRHEMGAGALAEALMPFLAALQSSGGEVVRITQGDVVAIACELARIDGYNPEDLHGGLYDLRWSGGPEPEPMGDTWNMEYLPKAERIAKALGYRESPAVNVTASPAQPSDLDHVRMLVGKLDAWRLCMSYNESYFGEPAGLVKSVVNELAHAVNVTRPPLAAAPAPIEQEG